MASKSAITFIVCGVFGVILVIAGVVLIHEFAVMIHSEVESNVPLSNGSESYKNWQDPKTPIYFQVWMFDIVNYEEVIKGEKPVVVEMGPYTYREHKVKINVSWNDNGTMFYRERQSFNFVRELSVGSENDTFHTVNLPMWTVCWMTRYLNPLIRDAVQVALDLTQERLFVKLSVYQLVWGYDDKFLHEADKILRPLNKTIPEVFGFFAGTNNTDDGVYEMYSGLKGTSNFGQIISWNGLTNLNYWTTDIANAINGSDGTLYPPFFEKEDVKYIFSTDICRSIGMNYLKPVTVRGIDLYRYQANDMMFANHTVNPYNQGFCVPDYDCLPSGLLNVSVCREGAPVVMSMPHFLSSDPKIINAVRGLHPDTDQHSSYIEIEKMTGVVMNAGKKLQVNAYLDKVDGYRDTVHLGPLYMPVMWLNESAMISASDASKFRSAVTDMVKLTEAVQYCLIAVGGFIVLVLLAIMVKTKLLPTPAPEPKVINSETGDDDPLLRDHYYNQRSNNVNHNHA